jgi:MarR family transcriptional regulator, organic hydroperoxide resistance regulator
VRYLLCQVKTESSVEEVVKEERAVETPDRSVKIAQDTGPLLAPLGFAFWKMKGAFERETGVSAGTWFTLALLAREDGMSQGELSQRFDIDPSRVTRLAKRLEREGLLRKERDRGDKRVVRMYLTDKGRGLFEDLSDRRERFDRRVGAVLSPEELKELRRMLGRLAESAEDWGR